MDSAVVDGVLADVVFVGAVVSLGCDPVGWAGSVVVAAAPLVSVDGAGVLPPVTVCASLLEVVAAATVAPVTAAVCLRAPLSAPPTA